MCRVGWGSGTTCAIRDIWAVWHVTLSTLSRQSMMEQSLRKGMRVFVECHRHAVGPSLSLSAAYEWEHSAYAAVGGERDCRLRGAVVN